MNFKAWFPELEWHLGYPFVLLLMLASVYCIMLAFYSAWVLE